MGVILRIPSSFVFVSIMFVGTEPVLSIDGRSDRSGDVAVKMRSRWVRLGDAKIYFRAWESSGGLSTIPIVLIHGLTVSSRYMIPLAELLSARHPVFAPDLPGFGRSSKPREVLDVEGLAQALAAWVDAVGLSRPLLVGNSMGCQVAVEYAARFPDALAGAVLVGPTMDPEARTPLDHIWRWLLDVFQEDFRLWPIMALDFLQAGPRRTLLTYTHGLAHPMKERLFQVEAPVLVVRGEKDAIVPEYWAKEAAQRLPKGQFLELPDATHAANFSDPGPLAVAILDFAREIAFQPTTKGG